MTHLMDNFGSSVLDSYHCKQLTSAACVPGRWPKHHEAYRKTKGAMGLQMAEELATGFGIRSSATQDFVDVFTGGFAFRLYLHSTRCVTDK